MPRPPNADLIKPWKINLPATLAGKIEYLLLDPIHQRPRYATRGFLIERLLSAWLSRIEVNGSTDALQRTVQEFLEDKLTKEELRQALLRDLMLVRIPTLEEVRDARS